MKKKILIQFDGSNFYKKVKKILPQVHLTNFDYVGLAQSLTKVATNDIIYYVSSDTDLLPAIQTAKDESKKIIYVGFENFISRALQKNCSSYLILKKDQILKFAKVKRN